MAVTYVFRCEAHGTFEEQRTMGHVEPSLCPDCGALAGKVITVPQFQEDRRRFWSNGQGTRYSSAFGGEAPESKAEEARLCKERGIELDAHEMPHVKRAIEIGRAVRQGEKVAPSEVYAHIAEPTAPPIPLAETLRKSGKMRAVAERVAVGFENWSDRGAESAAEMARKGAEALAAGPAVLRSPEKAVPL